MPYTKSIRTTESQKLKENRNGYVVAFDVSSLSKDIFKIGIETDLFSIATQKQNLANAEKVKHIRKEFHYNALDHSFHLANPSKAESKKK